MNRRRGRPRQSPCGHAPGTPCRACSRLTTRRWRAGFDADGLAEVRARDRARRAQPTEANARARARNYVRVYLARWALPRQACAGCSAPRALIHHPDLARPREFVWACRACIATPDRIAEIVGDGALVVLTARPIAPVPVPAAVAPRADVTAATTRDVPSIAPLNVRYLEAAQRQVAMAARRGAQDVTVLASYYVDLLADEDRARLDAAGAAADLRAWRPYGHDDLDRSVINLYYRRRQREQARMSIAFGSA